MILIQDKKDNSVVFAKPYLTLDSKGVHGNNWTSTLCTEDTAYITMYEGGLPPGYVSGCWIYGDNEWTIKEGCEDTVSAQISQDISEVLKSKLRGVDELRMKHTYSDVEVMFPSGPVIIQLRDDVDRTNLANVASGAMSYIITGSPETLMEYRTADNVVHSISAKDILVVAGSILAAKQAIVSTAWHHKDSLQKLGDLEDTEGILNYDITTGW